MSAGAEVIVYTSDASWAPKGNRSGRKYHFENPTDTALAACGRFVLDNLTTYPGSPPGRLATDVPRYQRCTRRACARRYEEADRAD